MTTKQDHYEIVGASTPFEAAKRLGVHPNTVYRMLDRGELPYFKVGNWHKRIPNEAIEAKRRGEKID